MLNQNSIRAVDQSFFGKTFRKPLYDSYCFSGIPNTIQNLLRGTKHPGLPLDVLPKTAQQYDKIIVFLIDGFGWVFFNRFHHQYPWLQRFVNEGVTSKLTTQFPSTTSANLTTIHSGQSINEHGLYEWFCYEPTVDRLIAPLLFSFAGDKQRETVREAGIDPRNIFPKQTFYQQLAEQNIPSYIFQYAGYTPSTYSDILFAGANVLPYQSLEDGARQLAETIQQTEGPAYYFFYNDEIDSASHKHGMQSPETLAAAERTFTILEQQVYSALRGNMQNTILVQTADHGQTDLTPAATVYINTIFPEIEKYIQRNKAGELLIPGGGSARDLFLHIQPIMVATVIKKLKSLLNGVAEVYHIDELLNQGLFGLPVYPSFRERLGNVVILPFAGQGVYWFEEGRFEQTLYGSHGGLTPEETDIPFLTVEIL
ncbi:MAG: alkaline phosphatase family protein [Candidatus Kerfeldbacteria bacterium]|nr:alkaline phosphatase family protein [Candidatus Kerfeldbacteria bacterium]